MFNCAEILAALSYVKQKGLPRGEAKDGMKTKSGLEVIALYFFPPTGTRKK